MTIEKVVCPTLNERISNGGELQVLVKFNNSNQPMEIMCSEYTKEELCYNTNEPCIYAEWKKLKK